MVNGVVRRGPRAGVPGPAAAAAGGANAPAAAAGGLQSMLGTVLRFGVMWYMMRSFNKPAASGGSSALSANGTTIATPGYASPVYRRGDLLDMRAYLSESPLLPADRAGARLVWVERDVPLAAPDAAVGAAGAGAAAGAPPGRRRVLRYVPSPAVAGNSSGLYLHVAFRRAASAVGPDGEGGGQEDASFGKVYNLVAHLPRPRNKTGVNLLGGDAATGGAVGGIRPPVKKDKKAKKGASSLSAASLLGRPREIVPFLRPGVGVAMVDHFQAYPRGGIPAPLAPHALLTSDGAGLLPWLWFDDFWQLRDGMHPLNASWVGGGPALTAAASGGEEGDADAAAAAAAEPAPPLMLPPLRGNMTEALEHASAPLVALHLPATAPASASASDADADADADDDDPDAPPATEEGRAALEALRARVLAGDVPAATLFLSLAPLSFWRMQIFTQMEASFKMQVGAGLSQEGESDDIKRIFLEGNPFLLAITMAVSLLHSVFDFLAFKNDIGFWRENKSLEGLSARSVLLNAFSQLVIFLYLLDNDTSMVVLLSAGAGTAIEFWKITKAFDVELRPLGSFPPLTIRDRASYGRSDTRKHDEVAMRYLSYVLLPLVAGYSIYALVYESHRSWYSWALGSLVGAVYAFGFILMCPQLYLNYKLQSVAHLPWRQMTYKFLNTIIDDLFAFVIKMPLLHRLSVFRDDVVFLVYLYQRWIYRVDPKRANEFGFSAEDLERREREAAEKLLAAGAGGGAAAIAAAPAPAVTEGEGAAVASGSAAATATAGAGVAVRRRKPAAGDEDGEEEEQEEQQPGEKKDR